MSIADILAMQLELTLLDEPTASLDPENVALLECNQNPLSEAGIALVVSPHDVDCAFCFARRAIVFSQGENVAVGAETAADLRTGGAPGGPLPRKYVCDARKRGRAGTIYRNVSTITWYYSPNMISGNHGQLNQ